MKKVLCWLLISFDYFEVVSGLISWRELISLVDYLLYEEDFCFLIIKLCKIKLKIDKKMV